MKVLVALCFCGLPIALSAQTTLRTFTSEDSVFQFKYSPVLVHCALQRPEKGEGGSWVPAETCSSRGVVCDDEDSPATTIACFAYPKDNFRDKPTFSAAAFFVGEVSAAATQQACLEGSQNWLIQAAQNTRINSVDFKHFRISNAWTSHSQTGDMYRVFHNKKCYELGIQEVKTSAGAYDPGTIKEFTKRDEAEVRTRLKQALNSFTFSTLE
jgi:hypothetical protein